MRLPVKKSTKRKGKYTWTQRYVILPANFPDCDEVEVLTPQEYEALLSQAEQATPITPPPDKKIKIHGNYAIVRLDYLTETLEAVGKRFRLR